MHIGGPQLGRAAMMYEEDGRGGSDWEVELQILRQVSSGGGGGCDGGGGGGGGNNSKRRRRRRTGTGNSSSNHRG